MNARIVYKVKELPYPQWGEKPKHEGMKAFYLCRCVVPEFGYGEETPVALFNYDSAAVEFQGHCFDPGPEGKVVELDPEMREYFENIRKIRERGRHG